jgi:hypothetical protein
MTIYSSAKVEEIKGVLDSAGDIVAPATEGLQQQIRDRLGNWSGLGAFEHQTSSTSAEQLDSNSVPNGVEVVVQAQTTNSGSVFVGNSTNQPIELSKGSHVSLNVTDTDKIHVQTPNSGDGVGVLFEQ